MTLNKRMPPAAMLALALMGLPLASQAGTITTQHGSKCTGQAGLDTSEFRAVNGIWNYTNGTMYVVCPVTRVGSPTSGGLRAWIDGYAPSGSTLSCELVSLDYDHDTRSIWYVQFDMTGTGDNFDRHLDLAKADVPMYSSQVVQCSLPPGAGIYDIAPESLGS
jgi:hypothetical protein